MNMLAKTFVTISVAGDICVQQFSSYLKNRCVCKSCLPFICCLRHRHVMCAQELHEVSLLNFFGYICAVEKF